MQQIVGVTELQRKFRWFFNEVVRKRTPLILTRGSRPEAVLIPYEDFLRFQQMQESEKLANFDQVWNRLAEVNAAYSDDVVAADVKAGRTGLDENQLPADAARSYLRQVEEAALEANIRAFQARQQELLQTYPDEFIAFHQGELVDHDKDFLALHRRVRRQYGRQPVLLRQVTAEPERTLNF